MEIWVEMIKRWFVIFVFVGLFEQINACAPGGCGQSQPELRVAIHEVCKASYNIGDQYYEELLTGQHVRRHFCQAGMGLWGGFRMTARHYAWAVSRLRNACHQCRSSSRAVVPLQFLVVRACCKREPGRKKSGPTVAECERRTV